MVDRHKRLIIRGDPGSGKTTLLKYLAVTCARTIRNNRSAGDSPNDVKKRLLWTQRPFPILVKLRRYGDVTHWDDAKELTTTRIVGYENQLDQYDFTVRTLHNLHAGEIRALVKQRYNAIAIAESGSRPEQEKRDIEQNMRERAQRLIEKVESTPRLNQLATNPMLLSLIVLVHSLKFELPDERLLLYRDCVEILAENWQQFKREEAGIKKEVKDELSLNQKLILLRELAFAMQQQRKDEGSPALMPKDVARNIIAGKLPDFLAVAQNGLSSEEISHKADAWLAGIQEESGILVEQGLDEAGEPLIGFSHLTFQEYLAAIAIYEVKTYVPILKRNLLQPAWQEVVLLYTALTNDATSTINALLKSPLQPQSLLLAGRCLGERLKKVNLRTQQIAMEKLKEGYSSADDTTVSDFGQVMSMLRENEITTFLISCHKHRIS